MSASEPKKRSWPKLGCLSVVGIIVLLTVIGALRGAGETEPSGTGTTIAADGAYDASPAAGDAESAANIVAEPVEAPTDSLTGPQRNAVRSAESYLQMTGFSRLGLIDQLSSDAGDGYSQGDATAAVDSLDVDWNAQAVRSAESYLQMTGFSCDGLVDQLSSSSGSQYTENEARFGAQQAGAC